MSASPTGAATTWVQPPELRPATFADFPAIHALESGFFAELLPPHDRRALFEGSPLWPELEQHWPVGWVMEDDTGAIVGSVTNVPSAYTFRGKQKICANGHSWVALAEHRGYAAMLMDEYYNQEHADLALSPIVGPGAAGMWQAYGAPIPLGDWTRIAYAVTNRRIFAREALAALGLPWARGLSGPTALAIGLKEMVTSRALPRTPDDVEVAETRGFDDRFDTFWTELTKQNHDKLLAVRDRATLAWHYRLPLRSGRLWVYTASVDGRMLAYLVIKQLDRPNGIHSMTIVDYQTVRTSIDLLPGLVRAAAARCSIEGNSMLEHRGCDIPKMRSFDRFAPYRLDTRAWSYHFRTFDESLAVELADPSAWDPSDYDCGISHR